MNFKGQTAPVVGASRGPGGGVVESLVASGMTVTAAARNRESPEDLARQISVKIIVADATDEQATKRILLETKPNLLVWSASTRWGSSAARRAHVGDLFQAVWKFGWAHLRERMRQRAEAPRPH